MPEKHVVLSHLELAMRHRQQLKRINSELRALQRDAQGDRSLALNEELIIFTEQEIVRLRAELGTSDV